jgi:hypothetical protein
LSGRLIVPPNITLIALPAKCPELNPQENIWQFMRDNWLSNRIFKSFDDIVDHCCDDRLAERGPTESGMGRLKTLEKRNLAAITTRSLGRSGGWSYL